jgi:hypothetical protein
MKERQKQQELQLQRKKMIGAFLHRHLIYPDCLFCFCSGNFEQYRGQGCGKTLPVAVFLFVFDPSMKEL